jgi:sporulation protein YlmC with PRC-barrel domain
MSKVLHSLPRTTRLALAAAVTAGLALPASAEGDKSSERAARDGAGAASAQAASAKQQEGYRPMRASELIGQSVRNPQDKDIGKIEDLVVDMNTGEVRYAVLAFDPGLFEGDKLFAVPAKELRKSGEGDKLVYDVRREQLERVQVDRSGWDAVFGQSDYVATLDKSYGIQQPGEGSRALRASDLLEKDVQAPGGKNIGSLEELIVDMAKQRVHYAVATMEGKEYVLPLHAFERDTSGDQLVLDIARSKVHGLLAFEEERYGNLNDRTWVGNIDQYLTAMKPSEGSTSTSGTSSADPSSGTSGSGTSGTTGSGTSAPAASGGGTSATGTPGN